MYPEPHKRRKLPYVVVERDRNVVRAQWPADASTHTEIHQTPDYQRKELIALNQPSFVAVLHAKLGSYGASQVVQWKYRNFSGGGKLRIKTACYVDNVLGKSWTSEFFRNPSEAREACAYQIVKYVELLSTAQRTEKSAASALLSMEDHKSRQREATRIYENLNKCTPRIITRSDPLVSSSPGLPINGQRPANDGFDQLWPTRRKRSYDETFIENSAPYIQAGRPSTAGRQTSSVTNNSQQAGFSSQAYGQLQNGNTPPTSVPTFPGAVEAFTQHVKVGSAPFYIFPDLRPLLQAGVAITEAHPSSYDERGHCVLGSRDQIAAQIIAEPFKRMRFLGNEDHHNLGLAAIVSFVADGDDFQQAAPADRGNYFAVLIRSLIRGACANGHMTTDDCYRVLGAMVETHFGVTLAVATEQNAGAQQPGLAHGQWSAFPPENASFSSSSTHPTRCPQSQPGFVSSVDTGKWVPNAPSGVFLAQDMDLDSPASTPTQTPGPGFSGKDTQPGAAAQAGGSSQTGGSKQVENGAGDLKSGLRQPPANTTPHPRRPPPSQVPAQPAQPAVAPSHVPPQFESFISGVRSGAPLPRFPTTLARPQPFVFGAPTPMGPSQAPATQKFQFGATAPMTPQAVPVFQNAPQPVPATTSNAQEPGPAPARTFESARQDSKVAASLQNLFNNR